MLCHMGIREVPVPAPCASVSQTWHGTGEGSYKHQQQPNAVGNTPSAARSPLAALPGSRVSPRCPRSLALSPARLHAREGNANHAGLCQHPHRHCHPAQPGTGLGLGLGLDGVSRHPCGVSQLTDSLPGLLLGSPSGQAPCPGL